MGQKLWDGKSRGFRPREKTKSNVNLETLEKTFKYDDLTILKDTKDRELNQRFCYLCFLYQIGVFYLKPGQSSHRS